jgi:K+-sensing histidine kinase KdpD
MIQILNTVHDLLNKYMILACHIEAAKVEKKLIPPERIEPVAQRIGELINDLCIYTKEQDRLFLQPKHINLQSFAILMQGFVDKLTLIFPQTHIFLCTSPFKNSTYINVNQQLIYQVIENIIENSVNAGKTLINLKLEVESNQLKIKIVDQLKTLDQKNKKKKSLPNGIGSQIIFENLKKMNASVLSHAISEDSFSIVITFPLNELN